MVIFARLLSAAALSLILAIAPAFAELPKYVEGEAIVVLRAGSSSSAATLGAASTKSAAAVSSESLASSLGAKVVHNYRPVRNEADASAARSLSSASSTGTGSEVYAIAHLRGAEGESTEDFIARLRENPNVVSATPNYIKRLSQDDAGNDGGAETEYRPDDPLYKWQWGLEKIGMPELWAQTMDAESEEVVVAVVDTGIVYDHEDLAQNMYVFNEATLSRMRIEGVDPENFSGSHGVWFHSDITFESGDDKMPTTELFDPIPVGPGGDTEDATPDDVISVTDNSRYVGDFDGHGTHVAGIIGAVTNNGLGVAGIAQNVKLMAVSVFSAYKEDDEYEALTLLSDEMRGMDFLIAAKNSGVNVRVANFSLGGWEDTEDDELAPYRAKIKELSDAGIIACIAAGNEGQDLDAPSEDYEGQIVVPAMVRFENTIVVGASGYNDERADFSNYSSSGSWVDIFAPGEYIASTCRKTLIGENWDNVYDGYGYILIGGTSMAAPHAAGVAALLCSLFPDMSAGEIKQLILDGANGDVLKDSYSAYGLIDAYESWRIGTERAAAAKSSSSSGGCNAGAGALLLFPVVFALRRAFKKER